MQQIKFYFIKAFLGLFIPITILVLPFFFHVSSNTQVGPYSQNYFNFLTCLVLFALVICIFTARRCASVESFMPVFGALTIILSIVVMLSITEIVLRMKFNDAFLEYRTWGHKKSIIFGFEEKPNHRWIAHGYAKNSTDPFGFRTHVQDTAWFQKNKPRIFVLGGSSAWGYGLADNETWPTILENILNQNSNGEDVQVINAANNGYNSLQLLLRFYLKVLPHNPKYIIFYEAINDVNKKILRPEDIFITENMLFSETVVDYIAKEKQNQSPYWKSMIGDWTVRLYNKIKHKLFKKRGKTYQENDENAYKETRAPNGQRFIKNVQTLVKICSDNNVKPILVTFIYNKKGLAKEVGNTIDYYNELLRDLGQKEKVILIDIAKDFETVEHQEQYFWQDEYHPNHAGAEFIAKRIAIYLITNNLINDILSKH